MGSSFHLSFEQLMQALCSGVLCLGVVPLHQKSLALRLSKQRQFGNGLIRIGDCTFQQHLKMSKKAVDGCIVEQVGVVFDPTAETLVTLDHE